MIMDVAKDVAEFMCGKIENGYCIDFSEQRKLPYQPGDVLYVRETFYRYGEWYDIEERNEYDEAVSKHTFIPKGGYPIYLSDTLPDSVKVKRGYKSGLGYYKRPSLFMPKEAARIFLRVTDVRAERLQEIDKYWSNYDKEGMRNPKTENISIAMQERFISIWNSTIKKSDLPLYGWEASPWVWVIEFERCEKP